MRIGIAIAVAALVVAVTAEKAGAQGGTARVICDGATGPSVECLGYNPFYVPPGSNKAVGFPTAPFGSPEYYDQARALRRQALGQSR